MLLRMHAEALKSHSWVHKNGQATYTLKFLSLGSAGVKGGVRLGPPVLASPHLDHTATSLSKVLKHASFDGCISVFQSVLRRQPSKKPPDFLVSLHSPRSSTQWEGSLHPEIALRCNRNFCTGNTARFYPLPCGNAEELTCIAVISDYFQSSKLLHFYMIFNTYMPYFSNTMGKQCEDVGRG